MNLIWFTELITCLDTNSNSIQTAWACFGQIKIKLIFYTLNSFDESIKYQIVFKIIWANFCSTKKSQVPFILFLDFNLIFLNHWVLKIRSTATNKKKHKKDQTLRIGINSIWRFSSTFSFSSSSWILNICAHLCLDFKTKLKYLSFFIWQLDNNSKIKTHFKSQN